MRISTGGLVIGIVFAAIDIFFLVYLPGIANQYTQKYGMDVGGSLGTVFLSTTAIALAIALAVLAIPIRAVKEAPKITGGAKLLQGLVLAAYYYIILNGGIVSISLLYSNIDLVVTVTLLLTLALLEVSAVFRVLQGASEMRERLPLPQNVQMPATSAGTPK